MSYAVRLPNRQSLMVPAVALALGFAGATGAYVALDDGFLTDDSNSSVDRGRRASPITSSGANEASTGGHRRKPAGPPNEGVLMSYAIRLPHRQSLMVPAVALALGFAGATGAYVALDDGFLSDDSNSGSPAAVTAPRTGVSATGVNEASTAAAVGQASIRSTGGVNEASTAAAVGQASTPSAGGSERGLHRRRRGPSERHRRVPRRPWDRAAPLRSSRSGRKPAVAAGDPGSRRLGGALPGSPSRPSRRAP